MVIQNVSNCFYIFQIFSRFVQTNIVPICPRFGGKLDRYLVVPLSLIFLHEVFNTIMKKHGNTVSHSAHLELVT